MDRWNSFRNALFFANGNGDRTWTSLWTRSLVAYADDTEKKVENPAKKNEKRRNPLKSVLSGGIAGGIEICITYPTEYVKTQMQLYDSLKNQNPISIAKDTVASHGVRGLYRGLTALLYFSIPKAAVRFWAFEEAKAKLRDQDGKLSATATFAAGLFAGIVEAIVVVTPMETIKVKLIHDQLSAKPQYRGFFHGVTTIAKQQGVAGCYKGLFPTILKQGSNQMMRMGVFFEFKRSYKGSPDANLNVAESMFAGALAGAVSVFGNTPIDVVKTRMQGLEASKYTGTMDCINKIWKNEGLKAFYKGTTPRLGRVCMDVALVMTLYEQVNKLLDRFF